MLGFHYRRNFESYLQYQVIKGCKATLQDQVVRACRTACTARQSVYLNGLAEFNIIGKKLNTTLSAEFEDENNRKIK